MAVSRWGFALWGGGVRSHGRSWSFSQVVNLKQICLTHPLSSASWALAPPNSLRYQIVKQPVLSHPFHHASQPQSGAHDEEDWEEWLSMLLPQSESGDLHTLQEVPLLGQTKLSELLALGAGKSEFSFHLTTVDGSREDDISIHSFRRTSGEPSEREHGCFRSLFEAERCPAPFRIGSHFYCFHCPGTEPLTLDGLKSRWDVGLDNKPMDLPLLHPTSLCGPGEEAGGAHPEGNGEGEEKLALAYERLRIELPNILVKNQNYTIYSPDVEFINGLINTRTRGRLVYRLTVSLWRLLCQCYLMDARLQVLKLTKHMEDGTIKARWRLQGLPLHMLLLRFYRKDKSVLYRSYDAFSTFYVGQDGLIHCHKVEKVMPAQPPLLPRVRALLAGALVALGVQENRPALNLLPLLLSSLRSARNGAQDGDSRVCPPTRSISV
ncbi:uncharacterized protein C6orf136 homolog [Aulostomus maculatus]